MANQTRSQLSTSSSSLFPDNTAQLISPLDLRIWINSGIDSFVTQKDVSTFENAFYEAISSSIVAAPTTNLALATGNFIHITGTTNINSFGTCPAGTRFVLCFDAAANIDASASIIIPGVSSGNTKTAVAGDCCMIISEGAGVWRIVGYFPAAGAGSGTLTSITASSPLTGGTITTSGTIGIPQANGSTDGYLDSADWTTFNNKQDTLSAGTGISIASNTVTNTAPDQTVTLNSGTGISVSGTYPSFTITNSSPSSGGTVTSVSGTGSVNGISLSGTVTGSGNLTLGGTLSGVDLTSQVTGVLPVANGGSGTSTPSLVAGTNVTISGSWPNQTINATGGGGGTPGGSDTQIQYNNGGSFGGVNDLTWDDVNNVLTANSPRIGQSTGNGHFHMHTINTSPPSGVTDYITIYADKSPKQIGARFETDGFTSALQFGATTDRTYTLPDASGNVILDTGIATFNNGTSAGEIRLKEGSGSGNNYTAIKAATTLAADYSLTLPSALGVSGQALVTDGSGNLSWSSTPGIVGSQFIRTTAATVYPASTALGVWVSLLIPASTFASGDIFKIIHRSTKTGTGNSALRVGFSTTNSLTGINYIGASTTVTGQPGTIQRHISITGTVTNYFNGGVQTYATANANDIQGNTVTTSTSAGLIDWTVDQYLIIAASTVAGDSFTNIMLSISPS